ncbi:MAG: hypothetical protein O3B13_16725 [Planctomycetota bacterium]|nr:hypothetical protein [Planctomycetota bacterium]
MPVAQQPPPPKRTTSTGPPRGKQLIDFSHEKAGQRTTLTLLSAPAAATYFPHIGMTQHNSCWITKGGTESPSSDVFR